MRGKPQKLWINNPSADTIVLGAGAFAGEVTIDEQMTIIGTSVTACIKECARPCVPNIWTIEFQDVDFGTCNDCGKQVGFIVDLMRHPDFDNQTYLDYATQKAYAYDGIKAGTVLGTTLATYFYDLIQSLINENDQHDQFYVNASVNGAVLTLEYPCTGLYTYQLNGIFQAANNNLLPGELPVITQTQEGEEAYLSRERLLRDYPMDIGHVYGEAPHDQFTWCENTCVIHLKGCIDPCSDWTNHNSGFLHSSATPFDLYLYVNSSSAGFAAFITALNAAVGNCNLDGTVGVNGECYQQVITGASEDIDVTALVFNAAPGDTFSLSNGSTTINVYNVISGADLVAKLTAQYPSGTFAFTAGPPDLLTVSGDFVSTALAGSSLVLCRVTGKRNYVGE